MAARLGQRSVPGTQIANARRATGLLQHRAVQHEDLGTCGWRITTQPAIR